MSQILIPELDRAKSVLFQDLYFIKKKTIVQTTVQDATCVICERGLEDGVSITAQRIGMKLRLFCQYHILNE